jgi:hypothetical protein
VGDRHIAVVATSERERKEGWIRRTDERVSMLFEMAFNRIESTTGLCAARARELAAAALGVGELCGSKQSLARTGFQP